MDRFDLMWEPVRAFLVQVGEFFPKVVLALVILLLGWLIAKAVRFVQYRAALSCRGDVNEPDRLEFGSAAGSCNARHGYSHVCVGILHGAFSHRAGDSFRDGALIRNQIAGYTKQIGLRAVGIDNETAVQHIGRAGDFGEQSGNQSAGTTFRRCKPQLFLARLGENNPREGKKKRGKHRVRLSRDVRARQ